MITKGELETLKIQLRKAEKLSELKWSANKEAIKWRDDTLRILEVAFGKQSSEYQIFDDERMRAWERLPDEQKQLLYVEHIERRRLILESILKKHESIGRENNTLVSIPPEQIFKLVPPQAFISHGKESAALQKLKEFIVTLGIEPIIVKYQASLDKNVPDKVDLYLGQADFVIILATADDIVIDKVTGKEIKQPRQNVIHEIGLAQKTHPGKIIYLLESGAEFPSNIRPKVWESFKQRNMMGAFLGIVRELRAYKILSVTKFPV
jgi:hypothetical protein